MYFFKMSFLCFFCNCENWLQCISHIVIRNSFGVLFLDLFFSDMLLWCVPQIVFDADEFLREEELIDWSTAPQPPVPLHLSTAIQMIFLGLHVVVQTDPYAVILGHCNSFTCINRLSNKLTIFLSCKNSVFCFWTKYFILVA